MVWINFSTGIIDEFRIYNRALTAAAIRQHYDDEKPPGPEPPIPELSTLILTSAGLAGVLAAERVGRRK